MNIWEAMAKAQKEDGVSGYDLINNEEQASRSEKDKKDEKED